MLQLPYGRSFFIGGRANNIPAGGRVTLRYDFNLAQDIMLCGLTFSQSTGVSTDISITKFSMQRPDVSGREDITQGAPSIGDMAGINLGDLGAFPIVEKIRPQSFADVELTNNSGVAITVSLTMVCYAVTEKEAQLNKEFIQARTP